MNTDSNFDKSYVILGHNIGYSNGYSNGYKNNFMVKPEYLIITLHNDIENSIPDNLLSIILNQINNKIKSIKDLTYINCPIGSASVRTNIENNFIKDYVRAMFLIHSAPTPAHTQYDKFKKILSNIFINYNPDIKYITQDLIEALLDNQDYDKIKKLLGFKIQIYKPGDYCPILLLNFNSSNLVNLGIFNLNEQTKFDSNLKSIVQFDNESNYLFEQLVSNKSSGVDNNLFDTIQTNIPSGLLIVLNCKKNKLELESQKYQTKYQIKYD